MKGRFVVSTDAMSEAEEKLFRAAITGMGGKWWHWLPNFWLIVDPTETIKPTDIRNSVKKINGNVRAMVIQVEPKGWSGLTKPGPNGKGMVDWIRLHWDEPTKVTGITEPGSSV